MTQYKQPKIQGRKVQVATRVSPETHRLIFEASQRSGLSIADYIEALVRRDVHLPNKLDATGQDQLHFENKAS